MPSSGLIPDTLMNILILQAIVRKEMDKLAADAKYAGKVNFVLVNLDGVEKAKEYHAGKALTGACPHGAGKVPPEYGLKYIPHKTLVGADGKVMKNFDGFNWSDIDAAL
ncbi:unnamed protein product [Polarella glacialis]|uniref:Alkyl hydroperoxide reductase subunit C/ Thiol specific antioxidant domain-containing protein n=1 Tax=Polarella glacialis TaxID=89957 RepID=A0A813GWC0_POLGL|nr:unnamed protein product [Polarella glacialis]